MCNSGPIQAIPTSKGTSKFGKSGFYGTVLQDNQFDYLEDNADLSAHLFVQGVHPCGDKRHRLAYTF